MVISGHYQQTIDARNRVELPEAIRQVSDSSQYVITRGAKTCLLLYPIEQWREVEKKLTEISDVSREVRYFYRRVMMWALDVAADKNKRIEIPTELKDVADLDQEVLLLGAFTHVELWDPNRYDMYLDEKADNATQAKRLND